MAELTEDIVASLAPTDGAMGDARGLLKKGAFRGFSKTEDGRLVFAECKGSAKDPYKVSLDFAGGGDRPTVRCNCPSRQRPCKHGLALALAFVAKGSTFAVAQAPAELLEKSDKLKERREKQGTVEEKPREVNKAALAKKSEQQRDALVSLEKFVLDLVTAGLGGIKGKGVQSMQEQANRMGDNQLYGARARLLHLAALLNESDEDDEEDDDDDGELRPLPRLPLSDEERHARLVTGFTQLWVAIRKGQRMLEGKAEDGESKSEGDAQLEALLGRAWKLPELKEAGYWVTERKLLELAHTHREDTVLDLFSAEGFFLDLGDGSVHVEQTSLPPKALRFSKLRLSRPGTVEVREAALYPGDSVNRRIRWNEKDETAAVERKRSADDYKKLHALAKPLDAAVKALREQLKNPLSPLDGVFLVKAAKFGQVTRGGVAVPVMEDGAGQRLLFRDPRDAEHPTTGNLAHAAAAFGPGSLAVRLWYDPLDRAIFGQALALFVGENHLRLGL